MPTDGVGGFQLCTEIRNGQPIARLGTKQETIGLKRVRGPKLEPFASVEAASASWVMVRACFGMEKEDETCLNLVPPHKRFEIPAEGSLSRLRLRTSRHPNWCTA